METIKLRPSIILEHKDDSVIDLANTICFGEYWVDDRRSMFIRTPDGETLEWADDLYEMTFDMARKWLEVNTVYTKYQDPGLFYLIRKDSRGNETYSKEVIDKLIQYTNDKQNILEPCIEQVEYNGVLMKIVPYLDGRTVATELKFENTPKDNYELGTALTNMIDMFVRKENSLSVQVVNFYDKCMKVYNDIHLQDVNQDDKLIRLSQNFFEYSVLCDMIDEWLPKTDNWQPWSVKMLLDMSLYTSSYVYRYRFYNENVVDPAVMLGSIRLETPTSIPSSFMSFACSKFGALLNADLNMIPLNGSSYTPDIALPDNASTTVFLRGGRKYIINVDTPNLKYINEGSIPIEDLAKLKAANTRWFGTKFILQDQVRILSNTTGRTYTLKVVGEDGYRDTILKMNPFPPNFDKGDVIWNKPLPDYCYYFDFYFMDVNVDNIAAAGYDDIILTVDGVEYVLKQEQLQYNWSKIGDSPIMYTRTDGRLVQVIVYGVDKSHYCDYMAYGVIYSTKALALVDSITDEVVIKGVMVTEKPDEGKFLEVAKDGKQYFVKLDKEKIHTDAIVIKDADGAIIGYIN